jgi:flagellar biosynthetic protein FliQ
MEQKIIDLVQYALTIVIYTSMPMLMFGLVVGLIVSIFQTVTSIQEQTLAFVPKILAVFISIIIFGPWIMANMQELFINIYTNFNYYLYQ